MTPARDNDTSAQNLGESRIGCINTAFHAYQRDGEEIYIEALNIIMERYSVSYKIH